MIDCYQIKDLSGSNPIGSAVYFVVSKKLVIEYLGDPEENNITDPQYIKIIDNVQRNDVEEMLRRMYKTIHVILHHKVNTNMNFTPKQLNLLNYIREYNREHGFSPTLAEMSVHFSVSTVTIFEHLEALERKGAIKRRRHEARSVEILIDAGKTFIEKNGIMCEFLGEGVFQETSETVIIYRRTSDNMLVVEKKQSAKDAVVNFAAAQMAGTIRQDMAAAEIPKESYVMQGIAPVLLTKVT